MFFKLLTGDVNHLLSAWLDNNFRKRAGDWAEFCKDAAKDNSVETN